MEVAKGETVSLCYHHHPGYLPLIVITDTAARVYKNFKALLLFSFFFRYYYLTPLFAEREVNTRKVVITSTRFNLL